MEKQHPLTDLMGTAMEKIHTMVDPVTEFWEKQQEKKGQPDPDVVE